MKNSEELRRLLREIDHKSYPAYKSAAGSWHFPGFELVIEHVQGDPFAAPSSLSVHVPLDGAAFPEDYYRKKRQRTALQDFLLRAFGRQASQASFQAKGSGKSGLFSVSRPGQELLERSACQITDKEIIVRFEVGFPANGRTINSRELEKILFDLIPAAVQNSLFYRTARKADLKKAIELCEDQEEIRRQLKERGLAAFVADGSVLPRESGVSDRPMKEAVPFRTPETLAVTLSLPHAGEMRGMGIPCGVTLIAGGGYHGKSTLLKALERGVYDHIAGDGREYVITDDTAVKLRAEDGRKVTDVDISLFIRNLPTDTDTHSFSTLDASGSTSQAAGLIEGIEAGTRLFLIDEDTSATNLMVRDELMQRVISREEEPIVPFLDRVRDLYEKAGISTILVIGSSGSYFREADLVLQMDRYQAKDITQRAKQTAKEFEEQLKLEQAEEADSKMLSPAPFLLPDRDRKLRLGSSVQMHKAYRGDHLSEQRLKLKRMGKTAFSVGQESLDLRYVEQIVDGEQTQTLACLVRLAMEMYGGKTGAVVSGKKLFAALLEKMEKGGFEAVCAERYVPAGLAAVRPQELYACINRL